MYIIIDIKLEINGFGGDFMETKKANWRLKEARSEKNLTQEELAIQIGLSLYGYQRKENGEGQFTEREMKKISGILEREVTDIFFN